jgi:hypothetical protein
VFVAALAVGCTSAAPAGEGGDGCTALASCDRSAACSVRTCADSGCPVTSAADGTPCETEHAGVRGACQKGQCRARFELEEARAYDRALGVTWSRRTFTSKLPVPRIESGCVDAFGDASGRLATLAELESLLVPGEGLDRVAFASVPKERALAWSSSHTGRLGACLVPGDYWYADFSAGVADVNRLACADGQRDNTDNPEFIPAHVFCVRDGRVSGVKP